MLFSVGLVRGRLLGVSESGAYSDVPLAGFFVGIPFNDVSCLSISINFQELPYQSFDTSQAWHVGPRPFFRDFDVLGAKIDHADTFQTITSSASDFLAVTFKALGDGVMDNVADVQLVYTHAECYRSDDDDVVGCH